MFPCEPQCRIETLTTPAILNAIKEAACPNGETMLGIIKVDVLLSRIVFDQFDRSLKALLEVRSVD
jgi:hypothetical protein